MYTIFWIGFSGFIVLLVLVIFAITLRIFIQNGKANFVNNKISVTPAHATEQTPVHVSGYVQSTALLPSTAVNITVTHPSSGESIVIYDPTFPTTMPGNCVCVPVRITFIPANYTNFFNVDSVFAVEARFFTNSLVYARAFSSVRIIPGVF